MTDGTGVPSAGVASAAGVATLESEALSPFELLGGGCDWEPEAEAASGAGAGESTVALISLSSLMGESSLTD